MTEKSLLSKNIMTTLIAISVILYPVVYGIILFVYMLSRRPTGTITKDDAYRPCISIIIASAGEGPAVIADKLQNTFDLEYRPDRLEIILFSDGQPFPDDLQRAFRHRVRFIPFHQLGKTECQNRTVRVSTGDVIIFTDVTSVIEKDALLKLVRWYADLRVGAVGGAFSYRFSDANVESEYISREVKGKAVHSRYGSVIGFFGPLYSVRRVAYPFMPDFYPSDLMLPVLVIYSGSVSILDPDARSYRTLQRKMEHELQRKRRIIAQASAATLHFIKEKGRELLKQPALLSALVMRKVIRWILVPYGLLVYAAFLCEPSILIIPTVGALGLLLVSLVSKHFGSRNPILLAPYYMFVIGGATILALYDLMRGETYSSWTPGSR